MKEIIRALEKIYTDKSDQETKILVFEANKKLEYLQIQRLTSHLQQAVTDRTKESLSSALDDIQISIKEGMDKSIISSDQNLALYLNKAKNVLKSLEKIEKRCKKLVSLKQSSLERICNYSKPPTEVRNVMEAVFILLGEDQEQLIVRKFQI